MQAMPQRVLQPNVALRLVMMVALGTMLLVSYLDLRRSQAAALADLTSDQAALTRAVALMLTQRMEFLTDDVSDLAESGTAGDARERLRLQPRYRRVDLFSSDGKPIFSEPRSATVDDNIASLRQRLIAASGDELPVWSRAIAAADAGGEKVRLLAVRRGNRVAVLEFDALLLYEGMTAIAKAGRPELTRWLVVDGSTRWTEFGEGLGDQPRGWSDSRQERAGELAGVLADMAAGQQGSVFLEKESAGRLGFGEQRALVAFSPVAARGARPWSVAVVTSARRVQQRWRLATIRLAITTSLAGLVVGLFGLLGNRQRRREQGLAEALRLAEATAALRERAEKIVEAIPLGVLALDRHSKITAANRFLLETGGCSSGTLREMLAGALEAEISAVEKLVADARATRETKQAVGLRLQLGGKARHVDLHAIPLGHPLPDVDCFVLLHDRSALHALERSLIRAEKLATVGTLAAGVAHEVGTPLAVISGRAEQLLAKVGNELNAESLRKGLQSILMQVEKVSSTIRQLLDFARLRSIEKMAVQPTQLLHQAAALLEHRFRQSKVQLVVDASEAASVAADPGQLEQVLVNLMVNACDACDQGGLVVARATTSAERVAIEIADNGTGIAAEHLSSVLDPFFTTKKRGQGTGLGLTIAADIVRNHGGSLELDSAVGKGTRVRVLLPR